MLITDKFIFINLPKTGSTFVRNVMKRIHADSIHTIKYKPGFANYLKYFVLSKKTDLTVLLLQNKRENTKRYNNWDEHGILSQIPSTLLKTRKVVSVIRNPLERYVSLYTYGDWKKNVPLELQKLQEKFPNFPNLTFEEFIYSREIYKSVLCFSKKKELLENIGVLTLQFIQFFSRKPLEVLAELNKTQAHSNILRKYFDNITFLNTDNLNQDLYNLLLTNSYKKEDIDFILSEEKHNTSREKDDHWKNYYDKVLINYVSDKERILLQLFSDFNHFI